MWGVFLELFYCLCRLCSSNALEMERNESTHLEDPNSRASSSSSSPLVGDNEGGTKKTEGNDYEVFLSFRGRDTRTGFTDYLYTSLVDARIHVFRDDNELRVGEEIGPELLRSITQSKISIPIISKDYASSKWCLRELAHILKCKRNRGQIVLPIFYKVEPSQLRNPSGRLRDAINAHKKKLGKIVAEEWEQALKEVSCLKGWESEKVENGHEGALVKIVVGKVMSELKRLFQLHVPELLVGIDDLVEHIMSKINATFNGTWIIGIYGMGGIGKTTLAKVLYNKLSSRFEDRSFVANIRETSERKGIECLQKQLIYDIIRKSFDVSNVDEGVNVIKSRFTSKKILVLLDDMDDIAHLNALFGDHSWFKAGSMVIITTRNKSILDKARANHMYPLNELPLDKSLILFNRHAFRNDSPQSDYEVISSDVVSTTGGLPLALEIVGSFLCGKTKKVWEDTLKKLQQVPDIKVQQTLRISYDALEYEEQQIFLDIACLFIGLKKEILTYMWDACGFFPEKGIEVLSLMSLIKIDEDHDLMMHDQLRDFGREIVRLENQREPQKRSRLWNTEEAADVIYNNKGTSKIEVLCLDKDDGRESYMVENFKELTNLRFLLLDGVNLTGDFHNLLPQLRGLVWTNCCLDFEEANFHPKKLIMLWLGDSQISEDWGGWGPIKVNDLPINILPVSYNYSSLGQSSYSSNDLPRNVVITLSQGSLVKSMDFHPMQQILLLVGTNTGDVMVWEVGSGTRIALRKFKIWDLGTCSTALQASLANDYTAFINRVLWSPNGILFGVAYSKHMVHIYSYHGGDDMRNQLEIEAHVGSVNDLSFSNPSKQLCVVTCGEDKTIKFIFSTATDGNIKTWLYDNMWSRVDYNAPDHSSTKMAYSTDGSRFFSCGTNKEGESYLVQWNEREGGVKRTYHGLGKRFGGFVQFDTAKNKFLVAGDEFMVKFWDMDDNNLLTSADADGGLPASPCIRFNKEGILLAVSTSDNSVKSLANADGIRLLRTMDNGPFDASRITPGPLMKDSESMAGVKPGIADDLGDKLRNWKPTEINEPSQCRSIRLPDNSTAARVPRLSYTITGRAILALSSNAVHKLWGWEESDQNLTGRATTSVVPQLWQPPGGNLMTNDTCGANPEDAVPCFAVNGPFLKSASGGEISSFDMRTFKTLEKFMPPPPPPPPNNDIIEIGMEDSAIQIYSARVDEIQRKVKGRWRIIKGFAFSTSLNVLVSSSADSQTLITFTPRPPPITFLASFPQIYDRRIRWWVANLQGHQKRITGLAFSNVLNVLVSSGSDSQLCVWNTGRWTKQTSKFLQMPNGRGAAPLADTRVQFHVDQIHLLVVHQTQIATCEAPKLECLKQWDTREASAPITDATYSCNGQSIYVSFEDGSIGVLSTSILRLICCINPAAYILPKPSLRVYPLVIAAHPSEPNQFVLGLTDGSVYVLEPLESEGEWGGSPVENGAGPSTTYGATNSDQPQR